MYSSRIPRNKGGARRIKYVFSCLSLLLCVADGLAQDTTTYAEQYKQIKAPNAVASIGADLFGDRVNLYNGGLEFTQTDVSLPGSSSLPVAVGRRLVAGAYITGNRPFGRWNLDIPHLHGVFSVRDQWKSAFGAAGSRCSNLGAPPDVSGTNSGSTWTATEFWQGSFLYVPGLGDQQLLKRAAGNTLAPGPIGTYPVVTAKSWTFSCLPSLKNDTSVGKTMGEGFAAISPDGVRYQFDWMVTFPASQLTKPTINGTGRLTRNEVWILPSRVSERFGNYVDYTYDAAQPKNLVRIQANDGRSISLSYSGTDGLIRSASDGTRTWTYNYSPDLNSVVLPDNSVWNFSNAYGLVARSVAPNGAECDSPAALTTGPLTGSMVHPSGAQGTFTLTPTTHGRSDVPRECVTDVETAIPYARIPRFFYSYSLTQKTITGPGLPSMTWTYNYGQPNSSWAPCSGSCITSKVVSVNDPEGIETRYTFGNQYNSTEGRLESVDTGGIRTVTTRYRAFGAGPYPTYAGFADNVVGDSDLLARIAPVDRRVTTQDGVTFTWEGEPSSYDDLARPVVVTRTSSLGYSRTESTIYADNFPLWVLGQVEKVTEGNTGKVMVENAYILATAQRVSTSKFRLLQATMTYNSDGTLATLADRKGQTTSFSNYKLGIPRNISYADGASESAEVNNIGLISWIIDPVNAKTTFDYDTMGRLSRITYPSPDTVAWTPTTISFYQSGSAAFDLPGGHWRQEVKTGNGYAINYYDAFRRPIYTERFDNGDPANTSRLIKHKYDSAGRTTFQSYAARGYAPAPAGISTSYDALGRVTGTSAASELGTLTTSVAYNWGFEKTATDARGHSTTTRFQAFDVPGESAITNIVAPEGVNVSISRDLFGKATAITRSGASVSATRSYFYDANERLCKSIEPETGAKVQDYDAADNVSWRAAGLSLPSTTSCDIENVPSNKKISFGYDLRNRLTTTTYSDGSPSITRTYTSDGLPATINANGANWTNTYNQRRLNERESLAYGGASYNISRAYDINGSLSQLTYPDGSAVAYSPNALGEPTQVGAYATAITYHPSGAIAGFRYGNGVMHSLTQNTRGLPWVSVDTGALNDRYSYDQNANVAAIADQYWGVNSRTMTYDDLDRLKVVSAPNLWGSAAYTYDGIDNLLTTTITAGGTARSTTNNFPNPATNLMMSISGTSGYNLLYAYDSQGNIVQRGGQQYTFDQGNRMTSAAGLATYGYDGLGHRVSVVGTDGVNRLQLYSQGGQILQAGPVGGAATRYVYLHNHVLAEVGPSGTQYQHTDALGSPVARTDSAGNVVSQTKYEPYGKTAQGATPTLGFTGHVNDADTALVYMQQRYYDPVAGRFLSIDPVTTDANTGGSFNRYVYANNSPYRYIDPDGRFSNQACADMGRMSCESIGGSAQSGTGNVSAGVAGAAVGTAWKSFEAASAAGLESAGYTVAEQVRVTWAGAKGGYAVIDAIGTKGGNIVLLEAKDGLASKLSGAQKAMFEASFKSGTISILDSAAASRLGLTAGVSLAEQGSLYASVNASVLGARASAQFARIAASAGKQTGFITPGALGAGIAGGAWWTLLLNIPETGGCGSGRCTDTIDGK